MSDLSATNCGCNGNGTALANNGGNSCLWIILLLIFCGGCGCGGNGVSTANNGGYGCGC